MVFKVSTPYHVPFLSIADLFLNFVCLSCLAVPATVVTAPANTAAKVSDDVKITCVAVGNLPIQLAWFNGSRKMRNNSRVTIKSSVEKEYYRVNGSLHIQKLLLQDTKQYSCRVTNEFGSDTKPFQITVQRKKLSKLFSEVK